MAVRRLKCRTCGRRIAPHGKTDVLRHHLDPSIQFPMGGECKGSGQPHGRTAMARAVAKPKTLPAKTRRKLSAAGRKGGKAGAGKSTPKKAAAARANGKEGGRPVEHSYFTIFAKLKNPENIKDPLELCRWAQKINAIALFQTVRGHGSPTLNAEIRASSKVIAALIPRERLRLAEKTIRGEAKHTTGKKNRRRGARLQPAPKGTKPTR